MNRIQAAEVFANSVFVEGVQGAVQSVAELLSTPIGQHRDQWEKTQHWYTHLLEEDKDRVKFLIKEAAVFAIFNVMYLLDTGSSPRDETIEFSLVARRTAGDSNLNADNDLLYISPTRQSEDLHDIFMSYVDEAETSNYLNELPFP